MNLCRHFVIVIFTFAFRLSFAADEIISAHQAATILAKQCAGCHQLEKHPGALFLIEAKLTSEETINLLIRLLETGQMPPPKHKYFARSKEGQDLLRWLKAQQPGAGKKKN